MSKSNELSKSYTIEELAHALYLACEENNVYKGTDKTKWREVVTADKLKHEVFERISAGKDSGKYGADAFDPSTKNNAEYKSQAIEEKEIRNLCENKQPNGKRYSSLTVKGVYNGAYTQEAINSYCENDHYFSVFHKELCTLIIKVDREVVREQLTNGLLKMLEKQSQGKKVTTNCNSVSVKLSDTSKYEICYRNNQWFEEHTC